MEHFKKGEKVFVRDYPFGRPLNVTGEVVGKVDQDSYNVLIKSGILEGDIVKYRYWKLYSLDKKQDLV